MKGMRPEQSRRQVLQGLWTAVWIDFYGGMVQSRWALSKGPTRPDSCFKIVHLTTRVWDKGRSRKDSRRQFFKFH